MLSDSDLRTLLELRIFDWEMDRLNQRSQVLPRELDRLDKELAVHRTILEDQHRALQDLRLDRRSAEREIENAKQHRRDLEEQQYKIRNNQQYQANLREIDNQKQKASQYEEKALEILEQEEGVTKEIDRLQAIVDEEKRKHELAAVGLQKELKEVSSELSDRNQQRGEVIERLSPPVRNKYERIRKSKGELAIVAVQEGACGGCGYALPPQRVQEVRRRNSVILCEGCGRILIWASDNSGP